MTRQIIENVSWCVVLLLLSFVLCVELVVVDQYCTIELQVGSCAGLATVATSRYLFQRQDSSLLFKFQMASNTSIVLSSCVFGTSTLCHYRLFNTDYVSLASMAHLQPLLFVWWCKRVRGLLNRQFVTSGPCILPNSLQGSGVEEGI